MFSFFKRKPKASGYDWRSGESFDDYCKRKDDEFRSDPWYLLGAICAAIGTENVPSIPLSHAFRQPAFQVGLLDAGDYAYRHKVGKH